jgi:predicted molibdopterin-dependent oxidoreductase YjgC
VTARPVPEDRDPIAPHPSEPVTIQVDGRQLTGLHGQTIAGLALGNGLMSWRRTSVAGRSRGLFCGIGVCFDCLVTVNGQRDVRACQRRARDGDVVAVQHDELPVPPPLLEIRTETGAGDA